MQNVLLKIVWIILGISAFFALILYLRLADKFYWFEDGYGFLPLILAAVLTPLLLFATEHKLALKGFLIGIHLSIPTGLWLHSIQSSDFLLSAAPVLCGAVGSILGILVWVLYKGNQTSMVEAVLITIRRLPAVFILSGFFAAFSTALIFYIFTVIAVFEGVFTADYLLLTKNLVLLFDLSSGTQLSSGTLSFKSLLLGCYVVFHLGAFLAGSENLAVAYTTDCMRDFLTELKDSISLSVLISCLFALTQVIVAAFTGKSLIEKIALGLVNSVLIAIVTVVSFSYPFTFSTKRKRNL